MRKRRWIYFVAPPAAVALVWACGELVMHLWNWLLPELLGWRQVTFWQALGLLLLSRILFGSWGSGGGQQRKDRWEGCRKRGMTDEERERIREGALKAEGA
jgi:hypothetical protein